MEIINKVRVCIFYKVFKGGGFSVGVRSWTLYRIRNFKLERRQSSMNMNCVEDNL